MAPVIVITIVYDAACGLCIRTKDWIRPAGFSRGSPVVASGSSEARRKFPQLPAGELAVVASTGEVWLGNSCLDRLSVGAARLPRPRREVDQAHCSCGWPERPSQLSLRTVPLFPVCSGSATSGNGTTSQEGCCPGMPNRAEVKSGYRARVAGAGFQRRIVVPRKGFETCRLDPVRVELSNRRLIPPFAWRWSRRTGSRNASHRRNIYGRSTRNHRMQQRSPPQ